MRKNRWNAKNKISVEVLVLKHVGKDNNNKYKICQTSIQFPESYSESCETSYVECFIEIVSSF